MGPQHTAALRFCGGNGDRELGVEISFESVETRRDGFADRVFRGDGIGGLQTVAGDAHDRGLVGRNATFANELLRYTGGHAASGFRADAFGLRQAFDVAANSRAGNISRRPAAVTNELDRVRAVGGIADGLYAIKLIRDSG